MLSPAETIVLAILFAEDHPGARIAIEHVAAIWKEAEPLAAMPEDALEPA